MSLRSFYINAYSVQFCCQAKCMKWSSVLHGNVWRKREVLSPSCDSSLRRVICTDSKLRAALRCQVKECPDKYFESDDNVFSQETMIKENIKFPESKYFNLMPIPNESQYLEELLLEQEFKDILSRSLFHYDVNLAEKDSAEHLLLSKGLASLVPCQEIHNCSRSNIAFRGFDEMLSEATNTPERKTDELGKPSEEQLLFVINRLTFSLLNFFEKPQDYTIYHKNIVFQNNIKGVITKGISAYIQNMYLMRLYGHFHYAKVEVEILKVTHHVEDGSIRVRWRVNGISRQKVLLMILKLKTTKWKEFTNEKSEWLDGFSVFSVGQDGLIYKHVCDKMIPDDEVSATKRNDFKSRLLGLFDLSRRNPTTGGLNAMLSCPRAVEINQGIVSYQKSK